MKGESDTGERKKEKKSNSTKTSEEQIKKTNGKKSFNLRLSINPSMLSRHVRQMAHRNQHTQPLAYPSPLPSQPQHTVTSSLSTFIGPIHSLPSLMTFFYSLPLASPSALLYQSFSPLSVPFIPSSCLILPSNLCLPFYLFFLFPYPTPPLSLFHPTFSPSIILSILIPPSSLSTPHSTTTAVSPYKSVPHLPFLLLFLPFCLSFLFSVICFLSSLASLLHSSPVFHHPALLLTSTIPTPLLPSYLLPLLFH